MSDEEKKPDEGSGTDNEVKLSEADHKQLLDDKAALEELKEQAELAGFESLKDFADAGELAILDADKKTAEVTKETGKSEEKTEKKVEVTTDQSAMIVELKKQQEEDNAANKEMTVNALLTSQWATYKLEHPDTELNFADARKEILSQKKGVLINHIAKNQTDGNYFAAVAMLGDIDKNASDLRQEGADAADAKRNAEQTADTTTGKTMKTEDDSKLTEEQKIANSIAPDSEYHYTGTG